MANHGQHEAGDQPHIVIERKPAVDAVARRVNPQGIGEMFDLPQHGRVRQGHSLLQPSSAAGMLNEGEALGSDVG